ncbi:AraC family transcriptional regulator [Thalassotalea euphylliae]|uniref:AraC family transcriptional regulator n=1 Tax=Thalassotalea euphylliae TaxID=1655234 RepID=A0A3E0TQG6_9GAMM|nr:AraC family transcriptional regulator [Thalassotalea euphylliae]REL26836.1 AraC family transcriptional regulator [Thalassotalea euphylliae]
MSGNNKNNWSISRDNLYRQVPTLGAEAKVLTSTASGSVVVAHTRYPAFSGEGRAFPYAVIALCTGGGGRARREGPGVFLDDFWQPGKLGVSMPTPAVAGFTPELETLTIAFNPSDIPFCHSEPFSLDGFELLSNDLFEDELISAVMVAILRDAEAHGAGSAFFEHGLSLILNRLKKRISAQSRQDDKQGRNQQLNDALAEIEQRLDQDLTVTDLANVVNLSPRRFTRLFKQRTGYTPFMYLTKQRMARAQLLLRKGCSVTDTAMAVGYANPAKFSAAFRRWLGQNPSSWQKHTRTNA